MSIGGKHWIGQNQHFIFKIRTGHVFQLNGELVISAVFSVSGNKGILGFIKNFQHPFMKRQTGSQHRGQDYLIFQDLATGNTQGV
jgi:hypothetical protein